MVLDIDRDVAIVVAHEQIGLAGPAPDLIDRQPAAGDQIRPVRHGPQRDRNRRLAFEVGSDKHPSRCLVRQQRLENRGFESDPLVDSQLHLGRDRHHFRR